MPATPASPSASPPLPAPAARLLRLLALHPGREIGLHAAAALAGTGVARTRQHLDMLVGAALVRAIAPGRYEIGADAADPAESARAAEAAGPDRADEAGQASQAALRRLLDWYLHSADAAQRLIAPASPRPPLDGAPADGVTPLSFPDRHAALDFCELEQRNIPAAARAAAAARDGLDAHAWRLCVAGWAVWRRTAPAGEWVAAARDGLTAARRLGDRAAEAWVLACLGEAMESTESREHHREALRLWRALGDRLGEARSVNALGRLDLLRRRLDPARERFAEALAAFRELGHRHGEAAALTGLAGAHHAAGRLREAEEPLAAALAAYRTLDDPGGEAYAMGLLGGIRSGVEGLNAARQAVELALTLRDRALEARLLLELGAAQTAGGAPGEALASYQRSAALHRRLGDRGGEALAWHGTGETYRRMGRSEEAAAFHGQAAAVHRELGGGWHWHEAVALAGLAEALDASAPDRAARHRAEALRLIAPYDDPGDRRAHALRQRLGATAAS
jgi:tetratricopeptide (TPR) repeat protein